jgi:hypothetical protein
MNKPGRPKNRELRAKIARKAAHRPPEHGLNKAILNSVHAWLTGEFYVQPGFLKPGYPPKPELLEAVLDEAIRAYDSHPTDPEDESDRLDHPVTALLDKRDEVAELDDTEPPQSLTKTELRQLLNAMSTSSDQRAWSVQNQ